MIDCGFQKDNAWFRYRSGALIVNDDKMLFVKCKFADYYYIIGGGVHHGEISADCVEREVFEETGVNGKAENLCLLIENFFKGKDGAIDNLDCHTLEFYYRVKLDDVTKIKSKTDCGEDLVWIPLSEIQTKNIKPEFIKNRISEILEAKNIIHVIDEIDR